MDTDSTPFDAGANDNASGAGLVLALAEQLRATPLAHTRVWLVCSSQPSPSRQPGCLDGDGDS